MPALVKFFVHIDGPIGEIQLEVEARNKNALKRVLAAAVDDYYLHAMQRGNMMHAENNKQQA